MAATLAGYGVGECLSASGAIVAVQFKQLASCLPHPVVVTNTKPAIVFVNRAFTEITGYSLADVRGCNPSILSAGQTTLETYESMWQSITAGESWVGEILDKNRDGGLRWVRLTVFPLTGPTGRITHYAAVHVDVSREHLASSTVAPRPRPVSVAELRPGMVLRSDLATTSGTILLKAGFMVDAVLLRRVHRTHQRVGVVEPLLVQPAT